ncbi:hypothetical protein BHY_1454 (plasmid) [Borrelia nietonii YOR]|uniref:Uncharacterized protein n=1 Tax=Borrelia nietonii YOR TaxID=1293576 RepID=W5SBE9_9SPIR|nr:hypothetical protein BHY_1454 [Borrelia nietonii YOR]
MDREKTKIITIASIKGNYKKTHQPYFIHYCPQTPMSY